MTPGVARAAEEALELGVEGPVGGTVIGEVVHVEGEAAVVVEVQELADVGGVLRRPVGRHPHDLVFALVDLEPEKRREDAVEETQGVREADLAEELDVPVPSDSKRRGRPLADAVHGQDGGLAVRRAVEGAGRM